MDAVCDMNVSLIDPANLLKAAKVGGATSDRPGLKFTVHDESKEEETEEWKNFA